MRGTLRLVAPVAAALGLLGTACGGGASGGGAARTSTSTSAGSSSAGGGAATTSGSRTATTPAGPSTPSSFSSPLGPAALQPGSDPSVLPADLLIADRDNNRLVVVDPHGRLVWEFPRPGDLQPGQTFQIPDDAFFTPDGREIVATQEDDFVISVIDIATHRIVYRYGTPGIHGMGPDHLWNPDDALVLPGGYVLTADIKNCRLLLIAPGSHTPARVIGTSTNSCYHAPPAHWGSPNGAFPMANGHYIVTEINGDWVDEIDLNGTVYHSVHPPGVSYPSDTNEVHPGVFVTVSYSDPGVLETFDSSGALMWRYSPLRGDPQLNQPSLAVPLPNGDFLMNDDFNHRVVVIDPNTDRVVWQYGHTRQPGSGPGYLAKPDGVDLAPPYSLVDRFAARMGRP
ncbi:MAG TPA: hypothetical protein VFH50_01875 [Acidimicrobiales bacterium]|nr:hypothetical protein [Acidimicrobiales bacterium]